MCRVKSVWPARNESKLYPGVMATVRFRRISLFSFELFYEFNMGVNALKILHQSCLHVVTMLIDVPVCTQAETRKVSLCHESRRTVGPSDPTKNVIYIGGIKGNKETHVSTADSLYPCMALVVEQCLYLRPVASRSYVEPRC